MNNYLESSEYFVESVGILSMEFDAAIKYESAMANIEYFSESTGFFDKVGSMIDKAVDGIRKIITKILDFIGSKVFKNKMSTAEAALKANPSLKNTKVSVTDYDKLNKLSGKAAKDLQKSKNPEDLMNKYRKQRNAILAASAVVTIGLGALFLKCKKSKDEIAGANADLDARASRLQSRVDNLKKTAKAYDDTVVSQDKNIKSLKSKLEDAEREINKARMNNDSSSSALSKKIDELQKALDKEKKAHADTVAKSFHREEFLDRKLFKAVDTAERARAEADYHFKGQNDALDKLDESKKEVARIKGELEIAKNEVADKSKLLHQATEALSAHLKRSMDEEVGVNKFTKEQARKTGMTSGLNGRDYKKASKAVEANRQKIIDRVGATGLVDTNGNSTVE